MLRRACLPCLTPRSLPWPCPACPADFPETDPSRPADFFDKPHDDNLTMLCIVGIKVGGWAGGWVGWGYTGHSRQAYATGRPLLAPPLSWPSPVPLPCVCPLSGTVNWHCRHISQHPLMMNG